LRTFQLRRYELDPNLAEEFAAWVVTQIIPLREKYGYSVHWQYLDRTNSQFIWLVSLEATEAEFEAKDAAWMASAERAQGVVSMPPALMKAHVSFVENV
jgi:prophage antirepressor-like protein